MKFIIPIGVGSIIGYFTNWLAIKMLFRPYREVRILGLRLPFTPGLIPKERYRMARSIGNTVGEHLLTPDKIQEVLFSQETRNKINSWIRDKFQELKKSKKSILDLLDKIGLDRDRQDLFNIREKLVDKILLGLENQQIRREILNYIEGIYKENKDLALKKLEDKGRNLVKDLLQSKEVKSILNDNISKKIKGLEEDKRRLKEILPREAIYYIDDLLYDNRYRILSNIRDFLHEEEIKKRIELEVEDLVYKNTSRIITSFVGTGLISDKIVKSLYKYINSESSEEILFFSINVLLERILNIKLASISKELEKLYLQDKEELGINYIIKGLKKEENIDRIIDLLVNNIRIKEEERRGDLIGLIDRKISKNIRSREFKQGLDKIVDLLTSSIIEKPMSDLLGSIDMQQISKGIRFIEDIIYSFGQESLLEVISLFNVSKIVEDQINSFEVEYTESLILEIAERELNAITRLGALLGGIIGLLSPLLQSMV